MGQLFLIFFIVKTMFFRIYVPQVYIIVALGRNEWREYYAQKRNDKPIFPVCRFFFALIFWCDK